MFAAAAPPSLWFELTVVWVSIGLSAVAGCTLFLAARHAIPEMRATFAAAGVLASIYCGSYIWLAFNFERSKEWSALLRPVGMLSWLVAWVLPASISMRVWSKLLRSADEKKGR